MRRKKKTEYKKRQRHGTCNGTRRRQLHTKTPNSSEPPAPPMSTPFRPSPSRQPANAEGDQLELVFGRPCTAVESRSIFGMPGTRNYNNSGFPIVPACANQQYRHYSGNRHYWDKIPIPVLYYSGFSVVPRDFTGTLSDIPW